jgi:hypothetical protein
MSYAFAEAAIADACHPVPLKTTGAKSFVARSELPIP